MVHILKKKKRLLSLQVSGPTEGRNLLAMLNAQGKHKMVKNFVAFIKFHCFLVEWKQRWWVREE